LLSAGNELLIFVFAGAFIDPFRQLTRMPKTKHTAENDHRALQSMQPIVAKLLVDRIEINRGQNGKPRAGKDYPTLWTTSHRLPQVMDRLFSLRIKP